MAAPPFQFENVFAASSSIPRHRGSIDDASMDDPMMGLAPLPPTKKPGAKIVPPQDPSAANAVSFGDDFDWSVYDYVLDEDGGYWQLQQGHLPSAGRPRTIPLTVTSRSPLPTEDVEWTCLSAACPSKPFKHKAELDNHYRVVHTDPATFAPLPTTINSSFAAATAAAIAGASKPRGSSGASSEVKASPKLAEKKDGAAAAAEASFKCDYPACVRKGNESFARRERFRNHLLETHKEDLPKKGVKMDDDWINTRKFSATWWRCSKCLQRVKVELHAFECNFCSTKCEQKRQEVRLALK